MTGHTVENHVSSTGLSLGDFIDDRIQTHNHSVDWTYGNGSGGILATSGSRNGNGEFQNNSLSYCRYGVTTEVKAVGVNFIVKY